MSSAISAKDEAMLTGRSREGDSATEELTDVERRHHQELTVGARQPQHLLEGNENSFSPVEGFDIRRKRGYGELVTGLVIDQCSDPLPIEKRPKAMKTQLAPERGSPHDPGATTPCDKVDDSETASMEAQLPTFNEDGRCAEGSYIRDGVSKVPIEPLTLQNRTTQTKQRHSRRTDAQWNDMFQQLVEYKELHGDCLVPSRYAENMKLAKWVETARYEYTKLQRANSAAEQPGVDSTRNRFTNARLTEERLSLLESIGFQWKVKNKMKRYYDKQWDQMLERLVAFKQQHGHCLVPKRFPADPKLGTWVHSQRQILNRTKESSETRHGTDKGAYESQDTCSRATMIDSDHAEMASLNVERRRRLDAIGFAWNARKTERPEERSQEPDGSADDPWDIMFQQLQAYKREHGDCLIPKRFGPNQKLATWVDSQRVKMKRLKKKLVEAEISYSELGSPSPAAKSVIGRLTEGRIRRLNEIGFTWSVRDDWQKNYEALKEFKARYGHCNVPARYAANKRLGNFVSSQRQQYKALNQPTLPPTGKPPCLTQERIDLLTELGFKWTLRSRNCATGTDV